MDFVLLAVLICGIWGLRLRKDGHHMSKEQTCAINGFFVLLVFLRHTVITFLLVVGMAFSKRSTPSWIS